MLKTSSSTPPPSGVRTTVRPNGHSTKPASLNAWMPNGMPMIVMHITRPGTA